MELRRSEPATLRRREPRCAHGLRLISVAGNGDAADCADRAPGVGAATRRPAPTPGSTPGPTPGPAQFELPRGLSVEALEGAHALLYERVRDGLEAYAQLSAAVLRRVPCDPDLQEFVESSLHDGAAAARRVNAVLSRLLDAAGDEGDEDGSTVHRSTPTTPPRRAAVAVASVSN
jgi:hypothetical protein